MSIQTSSNVFDNFRGVNQTQPRTNASGGYIPPTKPIPNDSYSFAGEMSENLSYSKEKSIAGPVFSGTLNGKDTDIKIVSDNENMYYEGNIGNKKLLLIADKNNHYTGTLDGKEINLNVEYNKPSKISKFFNETIRGRTFRPDYFNIKGTIDGKEVSIHLPNAQIPQNDDEKDMYSLVLFDNGCAVRTFQNNIIGIGYSNENRTNIKRHIDRRDRQFDENVKPLVMQTVSTIASVALGALLVKIGIKH